MSQHNRLCRDGIFGNLQIKSKTVIDKNANLDVNNATFRGDVKIKGSILFDSESIDRRLITKLPNVQSNVNQSKLSKTWGPAPDPIIAAGPKSIVTMNNTIMSIHRKNTMEEIFTDTLSNFWSELFATQFIPFDPWVVYDEFSKRFFLVAIDVYQISATDFSTLTWIAVSKDSNPQNADDFYKYLYEAPHFADYPKIAIDKEALYITSKDITVPAFLGRTIVAFDKAPLVDGSSSPAFIGPVFREEFYSEIYDNLYISPLQPRPSQSLDCLSVEKVLFITARTLAFPDFDGPNFSGNTLRILQVKNVLTNPEIIFAEVEVPEYRGTVGSSVPQPPPIVINKARPTITEIDASTGTLWGMLADNSIWATHGTLSDDDLDRVVARWYQIDVSKFLVENELKLVQSGNADPGGLTNQIWPSINVNKCGDMAIQFTLVGENQYPAIAYTGRLKSDPKGTVRLPLEVAIGGDLYFQLVNSRASQKNRYGDYTGLVIDPCDHETFWLYNQYPIEVNPNTALLDVIITTDVDGLGPFNAFRARHSPFFNEVLGPGELADPLGACDPLDNDLTGKIGVALPDFSCSDGTMVTNVESANAIATIIVFSQSISGSFNGTQPAVNINQADGTVLIDAIENGNVNIIITGTNWGSDWTNFIGAFKLRKWGKELNAPQTQNVLSQSLATLSEVECRSSTKNRTVSKQRSNKRTVSKERSIKKTAEKYSGYTSIDISSIPMGSVEVTIDQDGKEKRTYTIINPLKSDETSL